MEIKLIKIGSSRGIIIPKPILQLFGIKKSVRMTVVPGGILLRRSPEPGEDLSESLKRAEGSLTEEDKRWLIDKLGHRFPAP